jgi:hypothetical protein
VARNDLVELKFARQTKNREWMARNGCWQLHLVDQKNQITNIPHLKDHEGLLPACTSKYLGAVRIFWIPRPPMPMSMEQADRTHKEIILSGSIGVRKTSVLTIASY